MVPAERFTVHRSTRQFPFNNCHETDNMKCSL